MIKDLVEGHLTILSCLANVMEEAKQVENEAVFDLAVERSRAHDKQTWMLKALYIYDKRIREEGELFFVGFKSSFFS